MSGNILKEIASVLLDDEVSEAANEQLVGGKERIPICKKGIDFRLLKTDGGTSNLEFLAVSESVRFFQPVCVFSKGGEITVLKEFESSISSLNDLHQANVKKLSLRENAMIAAFSARAVVEVTDVFNEIDEKGFEKKYHKEIDVSVPAHIRYSRSVVANGLEVDLHMTFSGYPQAKLDPKYELDQSIGVYRRAKGGLNLMPTDEFGPTFERMQRMDLLTAYKIM